MTAAAPQVTYPWQPQSEIRGNLAVGNLRENLLQKVRMPEGIHAPTLLTFIGAIAGFAAQNAVWRTVAETGQPVPNAQRGGPIPQAGFLSITAESGEKYYFGDMLNAYLVPQQPHRLHLWGFVAGAAATLGFNADTLSPIDDMFSYVTQSIGTANFGVPQTPLKHKPSLTAGQALKIAWSFARTVLNLPPPEQMRNVVNNEPPLVEEHWPIIASIVAAQLLQNVKDVVEPPVSVAIIMESAIAASKIDPQTVAAAPKIA